MKAREVIDQVAAERGLSRAQLLYQSKSAARVSARREAINRMRHECGMSLPAIGKALNMHHTTVLYHLNRDSAWDEVRVQCSAGYRRRVTLEQARELITKLLKRIKDQAALIAQLDEQIVQIAGWPNDDKTAGD